MMNSADYQLVAAAICTTRETMFGDNDECDGDDSEVIESTLEQLIHDLGEAMVKQNPRFDKDVFAKAAGAQQYRTLRDAINADLGEPREHDYQVKATKAADTWVVIVGGQQIPGFIRLTTHDGLPWYEVDDGRGHSVGSATLDHGARRLVNAARVIR